MRKNGYGTIFFLGTDDVNINKIRVQARVSEGGHDIPEPIIEQRYAMCLTYLKSQVLHFTDALLVDVSSDEICKMAELMNGRIIFKESNCPKWVSDSLEIVEKLEAKRNSPKE